MSRINRGRKPYPWKCGKCLEKSIYAGATDYARDLQLDGHTYHIRLPNLKAPRCRKCGTVLLDSEANGKITAELLRQAKLLSPGKIRKYRERLGISQHELAGAIGIPEEMIARFEDGGRFQERTVDNMLRLFFGSPEARELLTKRKLSKVGLVMKKPASLAC